jgi:hypothetical protein
MDSFNALASSGGPATVSGPPAARSRSYHASRAATTCHDASARNDAVSDAAAPSNSVTASAKRPREKAASPAPYLQAGADPCDGQPSSRVA